MRWRHRVYHILCLVCLLLVALPQFSAAADSTWSKYVIGNELDYASGVSVGDINGDGNPDVVAAGSYASDVVWYRAPDNPLTSSWKKYVIDDALGYAWDVCIADIDRDGKPDVVASGGTDNSVVWYQQPVNSTKPWPKYSIDSSLTDARNICVADIDADGHPDVVATGYGVGALVWYRAPADPTQPWTRNIVDNSLDGAWGIFVADIDSDGRLDIAATGKDANAVAWYQAPENPALAWTKHILDSGLYGAEGIAVADVDNDHRPDIIASGSDASDILWYQAPADPTQTWTRNTIATNLNHVVDISVFDVNSDGRQDCVAIGRVADVMVWYECPDTPSQLWTEHVIASELNNPLQVFAGEIDGDGSMDIVVSSSHGDEVLWYRNPFISPGQSPAKPVNLSPVNGATEVSVRPVLQSSPFSGGTGRVHSASRWQITDKATDYTNPVFDSNDDAVNLIKITIPPETIDTGTAYFWRVKYMDDASMWSEWSEETAFTTGSLAIRLVPSTTSPIIGLTFTVAVQVEAEDQQVSAVNAYVNFDSDYLEAIAITPDTSKIEKVTVCTIDNEQGQVNYNASREVAYPVITGVFKVATITFKCLQEAEDVDISFSSEPDRKTDILYNNGSIMESAIGCTIELVHSSPLKLQTSNNQSVVKTQEFTLLLEVCDVQGQQISGVDAFINFDPTYLEAVEIVPDTALLAVVNLNSVDNAMGYINLRVAKGETQTCPSGTFTVAAITFRAKEAVDETPITISLSGDRRSNIESPDGVVYGDCTNAAVKVVDGGIFMGYVSLQGTQRPPWSWQVPLTLKLYDSSTTLDTDTIGDLEPIYVFSTIEGGITIDEIDYDNGLIAFRSCVPVGTYHIALSSPQCLTDILTDISITVEGATIRMGALLTGNADGDDKVTENDLTLFLSDYLKTPADAGWYNGRCDFDGDDRVTCVDFSLISSNYTPPATQ